MNSELGLESETQENTNDILQRLSKYYREVLKYVSSSASRVLQNVAAGQRYGLVADLCLLVLEGEKLNEQIINIHKPKKKVEVTKFEDEEQEESTEVEEGEDPEEPEITDEDVAWSAVNKIWRNQENNPYERETLVGQFLVKATTNKKNLLAPLLIFQAEITYDPIATSFTVTKLSSKPDLNRSLIATLLPADDLGPVRNQINEIFLEAEEIDISIIKEIIDLLGNHVQPLKDIKIVEEPTALNEIVDMEEKSIIINSFVLINTPRTGSFVLDDLDILAGIADNIEDTPIGELLTVNFDEDTHDGNGTEGPANNLQQDVYYFPLKSNIQQQRICDNVMSKNLSVVWGPPGTGKSETISNLVCHLIANGKSVLVTSQQQKALEVVRDKLKKNVSLTAPNHPNLTVPLELALIKGEKESTLADDIRTKLDALGAYTLGIGSYYEIQSKLQTIQEALKTNKEKSLVLMKRFSELKFDEKERYRAKKDSPLKLQELREFALIDPIEFFTSDDQNTNEKLIKLYAELLIALGLKKDGYIKLFGSERETLKKGVEKITSTLSILLKIQEIIELSQEQEVEFVKELLRTYSNEEALSIIHNIKGIWVDIQKVAYELSLRNKKFEEYIQHLITIPDESYEMAQQILKKLGPIEKDIQAYDLIEDIDLNSISLNQLIEDLEILKNTKPRMWTNILDSKAKQTLERTAKLLNLKHFDWRNQDLICDQLEKIVDLLRAKHNLTKIEEEFGEHHFDLAYDKLNVKQISQFILELKMILSIGKLLKDSHVISSYKDTAQVIAKYIDLDNVDRSADMIQKYKNLNDYIIDLKKMFRNSEIKTTTYELLTVKNIKELHSKFVLLETTINNLHDYFEVNEKLSLLPISKQKILELIEKNKYKLPEIFSKTDLIIEQHRLTRLYENLVSEETTEAVAQALRKLDSNKKELIYNYILNTRLKTLYGASQSRLANANLVKLKTLLGKKKKTLNFLRKKDSIDFSQVLQYFPCWLASIDDVARYFPLEKGLFDYVIVDEASQCSQTAIPHLFYRAKNAVIVGDEKQLPNANLRFLQKGIMDALLRKYKLDNHDKSQFMDAKEFSLLTFAQAATPPQALIEHFRCDPTIIAWSNKYVYNNMMKIMSPIWENRFDPPMEVRYVADGAEDVEAHVNPVEAKVILEELQKLISDKTTEGLTIGVISPFRPQADLISEMIYKEINPEIIKKFAIQARTVDGFQGDERDIILYSMRSSPNSRAGSVTAIEHGVNEEGFKRMNVAFTRARRKVIIFTSQKPALFPGKYIKSFMEHAQNIQETYTDPFQPKDDQFDSQFEEDVCRILRGRGINVITQFECAGYRIDQVIFDKEGRTLAVELDGDFKMDESGELPPEHYMRQATIERVTQWDVSRVTASTFYLNPEEAIEGIINALKDQPTRVERKINQTDMEVEESAKGLAVEEDQKEDKEMEKILEVVESNPEVEAKVTKTKTNKSTKTTAKQSSIFEKRLDGISTDKDLWFELSHWGKSTGNFTSFQNRFCYSLGMYITKKNKLTSKQEAYGRKLLGTAIEKGFTSNRKSNSKL